VLAGLIARVNAFDPLLRLDVRINLSSALVDQFERGELDAVIVRREANRRGGDELIEDELGWFAAPDFRHQPAQPLPLAMLAAPCGVRAHAIRTLDKAKVKWVEAFTGGGVSAVAAAVSCGLAVAPLARRLAPPGALDVGRSLGLPPLGRSKVVLHARVADAHGRAALRILAAAFRSMA
jgi:DNA-binding transcriptional LysR family regulator